MKFYTVFRNKGLCMWRSRFDIHWTSVYQCNPILIGVKSTDTPRFGNTGIFRAFWLYICYDWNKSNLIWFEAFTWHREERKREKFFSHSVLWCPRALIARGFATHLLERLVTPATRELTHQFHVFIPIFIITPIRQLRFLIFDNRIRFL